MIFDGERPVLITGGAGFIGTNLADRLLSAGQPVLVYDNLGRAGTEHNLAWLQRRHDPRRLSVVLGDVRDQMRLRAAVERACRVFHFAAQVAVTTSLVDPWADFQVNAGATLLLLEAIRQSRHRPPLLYTSTNKVYGSLEALAFEEREGRCQPVEARVRAAGIAEDWPLDFHSPYGCSKGAADQYVLDYARVFQVPAVVFRMSCIYGPHQRGTEDQGWVAHFVRQALADRPITICGNGCQVRDLLHVDDLLDAMLAAQTRLPGGAISGRAFNIGGGVGNAVSLRDVLAAIERLQGRAPALTYSEFRPADQRYYVSDTRAFAQVTGWAPRIGWTEGLRRLHAAMAEIDGPTRPAGEAVAEPVLEVGAS